jgi:hypothetical protein
MKLFVVKNANKLFALRDLFAKGQLVKKPWLSGRVMPDMPGSNGTIDGI